MEGPLSVCAGRSRGLSARLDRRHGVAQLEEAHAEPSTARLPPVQVGHLPRPPQELPGRGGQGL